jgi:hypothetical protein
MVGPLRKENSSGSGWYNNLHVPSTSTILYMYTVLLNVERNVPCETPISCMCLTGINQCYRFLREKSSVQRMDMEKKE